MNNTVLDVSGRRYTLMQQVDMPEIAPSELWEAIDADDQDYTLKITPYSGEKPPPELRDLWDKDLRVMYRLSSSPDANRQLVVMENSGIDLGNNIMALVYKGSQYVTFENLLAQRKECDWLSFQSLQKRHVRRDLWTALFQLALGLKSLHDQNLIHRHATPQAIWGKQGGNALSLRLSGFDWSARIGHANNISARNPWATPPDLKDVGYSFASDWYGFGTTVARCFYDVRRLDQTRHDTLARDLVDLIAKERPFHLEPLERDFIQAITAPNRRDRLQRATDILQSIENVIEALSFNQTRQHAKRRVLLHIDPNNQNVIDIARNAGFMVDADNPFITYDKESSRHKELLKVFFARQAQTASLSWSLDGKNLELRCKDFFIYREKWFNNRSKEKSWKAINSYINTTSRLHESSPAHGFDNVSIEIAFTVREANQNTEPGSSFTAWDQFAPRDRSGRELSPDAEYLRQFLHTANQFEVLLRDAELFKYKIVNQTTEAGGTTIIISSIEEKRDSRQFFNAEKSLAKFLEKTREAVTRYSNYVFLTKFDALLSDPIFIRQGTEFEGAQDDWLDKLQWAITGIDEENETITLFRQQTPGVPAPPAEGYLRTRGHYGQIRLIQRRKQAIDRLPAHAFLLQTLAVPTDTSMDTEQNALPWPKVENGQILDANKLTISKDILRTRPLYALQGPPGTGKSTLVAHLLRQILEDDPMAQILVTAKDHAAVDVLLDKVMRQAYRDAPPQQLPLAIRLNRPDGKDDALEQAEQLIQTTLSAIDLSASPASPSHKEIQCKWRDILHRHKNSQGEHVVQGEDIQLLSNTLIDLIKRGASITYCTTSAGSLEELAKGTRSFDWSIVEEAGKVHGFDLALPLQAGHRWLLLGDHQQLRPFQHDEFVACFNHLRKEDGSGAIDSLDELVRKPKNNARLVDVEWIKNKLDAKDNWAENFPNYAHNWLSSLQNIIAMRRTLKGVTTDEPIGASVGLLTKQYRMPPVIGDLISTVFYQGTIGNATGDAESGPTSDHHNPFVAPSWLAGKSLIWLDTLNNTDHAQIKGAGYANRGEQQTIGVLLKKMQLAADMPYEKPLTIAILTPYNMQKLAINRDAQITAPQGCLFGSEQGHDTGKIKAYSIDAFQGDEADIIIVSFVRNRPIRAQDRPQPSEIEFILQPDRLNVMFSRPRRLLIIVGCWDYLSTCVAETLVDTDAEGNYLDRQYGPFKKIINTLQTMFDDGRALKISIGEALS